MNVTCQIYKIVQVVILVYLLSLFLHQVKAQGIVSGDTISPGIVYMDIDDLMVSASFPSGYDSESLDFNQDGVMDLKFTASATATMGSSLESSRIVALAYAETISYPPHTSWVDELPYGITIDENSLWASGGTLKSESSFPDTMYSSGIFSYGYAGFRIPVSGGYLYGWVHLSAGNSHVFVHDYAYQSMNTSLQENSGDYLVRLYPNPAKQFIKLSLAAGHEFISLTIIDAIGNIIVRSAIEPESRQLKIDISSLSDGVYVIVIEGKATITRKFLKSTM